MIIDCISDLHGHYPKLEGGDLLIVAGDLTAHDDEKSWIDFENWIYNQKYREKIIISGNHDNYLFSFDEHRMWKYWEKIGITYLCDSGTEFEGLKVWGSPWTKRFEGMNPNAMAFTVDTEEELDEKWKLIPDDIDILVTHGPSFGNLDYTINKESVGSIGLWMRMLTIRPKIHIFGHIHEAYGNVVHYNGIRLVNASHVNERYEPVNKPVRIIL